MSECVDTFPVVTRLKLDRICPAVIEPARAGPAKAAATATSVDAKPSARMEFVISVKVPSTPPPAMGRPKLGAHMRMLHRTIKSSGRFSFGNLLVTIR